MHPHLNYSSPLSTRQSLRQPHASGSLSDLLASLSSMKSEIKEIQTQQPVAPVDPIHRPIFDWKKALELARIRLSTIPERIG